MHPVTLIAHRHAQPSSLPILYIHNILNCSLEGNNNPQWAFCNLEKASGSNLCYSTFKTGVFCPLKLIMHSSSCIASLHFIHIFKIPTESERGDRCL